MDFGIFAYNSRTRIIDIRCFRSNQFHHLSLNIYIFFFYSQFLRSPRRLFHVFERKKYRFPFFSFFTIRAQHNSNNEVRILDGFLYVNLIRLSFLVSYPPPLFIPKYLPIPHFYLYNISRNLFPQKLSKNLF